MSPASFFLQSLKVKSSFWSRQSSNMAVHKTVAGNNLYINYFANFKNSH